MNRLVIFLLYVACPSLSFCQTLSRDQVVGTWTAKEISFTEKIGDASTVEKAKRGLVGAQFVFQHNGIFLMRLPSNAPPEFRELESMNNKMWHIKSKERMVFVGSLDEDLMTINVMLQHGSYYFMIRDTPLIIRVERNR